MKIIKVVITDTTGAVHTFTGEGSLNTYNSNRKGEPTEKVLDVNMVIDDE